jgi:hypothetical protein
MVRCCFLFLGVSALMQPLCAEAQHCSGGFGFHGFSQPWVVNPGLGYSGYVGPGYGRVFSYQVGNPNLYYSAGLYSPQPVQPVFYQVPTNAVVNVTQKTSTERSQVPVVPSSPAARLRSLEHQARGDQRLREQKWSEARAAYRSSVDAAPDRAEAHLRLGLCLVAIQRFEPAIHEFKRALFIDPLIPQMGQISKAIFGPDSKMARASMISKLTDWVRNDYTNPDRLFLMGVILHFEGDVRGREFFEAAMRMKRTGDVSHIASFVGQPAAAINAPHEIADHGFPIHGVPKLNEKPLPLNNFKPDLNARLPGVGGPIPGAPVPMPDL